METDTRETMPLVSKGTFLVDRVYSRKDRQWHFAKTTHPPKKDRFKGYSLVVQRDIDFRREIPEETSVKIKSQNLVDLFQSVLRDTRCEGVHQVPPTFKPEVLFHVAPLLTSAYLAQGGADKSQGSQTLDDIKEVDKFVDQFYGADRSEIQSLHQEGKITFKHLWSLFPPGCVIIEQCEHLDVPQAYKFSTGTTIDIKEHQETFYQIEATMINHDGRNLGWGENTLRIPFFSGTKAITNLSAFPLRFHPDASNLLGILKDRGKSYICLQEPSCKEYEGMGVECRFESMRWLLKKFYSSGKVMIDTVAFRMNLPNDDLLLPTVFEHILPENISDENLIFCNHRVLGYSFDQKKWGGFAITRLEDVTWDTNAIDKLVVSEKRRNLISALIKGYGSCKSGFDDIIQGKGKGLVGLLSGAPGTGKTLTAEVVAELAERALYIINAGELGVDAKELDMKLSRIMSMVRRWGCVLLIDEAEIFLRKRVDGQLQENVLVGAFLRRLEYFQGIVILTTNRHQDIDEAFKSRIHFKFNYLPLNEQSRLAIWKNFLPDFEQDTLKGLARFEINGREIKNTISCATIICQATGTPLTVEALEDALENFTCAWDEIEAQV
ncbi:P-loop containing nucleoside triphosphate hydrolase protein [Annulohypoxylon maeteangense]|uniref:P-loop containing nucleoside triphosphate hydrolase protein n=1 Tax=Annulohypoxylon maeteangense TaxID=1927788 RepID=UPI0020082761|nr:P-loop containing nucleoside triphosphate hydrolase protein [Annulohypoxylon maeteangense]KAI0888783.1 P-loop containing nucleoside triphosphate hydrolase protein [Annulohypoxylon maeteangense]